MPPSRRALRRQLKRAWRETDPAPQRGPRRLSLLRRREREPKPRLKKLRFALVLAGLSVLAVVSWVFGIMMAVAQDLPSLENRAQYAKARNSIVLDYTGKKIATLTGNEARILLSSEEIAPTLKQAVVAIEDERFYAHRGIDYLGILRAIKEDILAGGAVQGASTITQQFVKNALEAQDSRTVLQKLREAALAYHIERRWSKDKILTEYLNSIYFGEGAYGVEAAARTYFGWNHPGCGEENDRCASQLEPAEAAMLAALISSPSAYSPRANPESAREQRAIVLRKMLEQGALTEEDYEDANNQALPPPSKIELPEEDSEAPYFTSWLRQQVVDLYGAGEAFGGGLQIHSSLDIELQRAVDQIVQTKLAHIEPTASVVVIDNETGGVRAMVGGPDYSEQPFNLATQGHRQPGSAFKPFTLVAALQEGHTTSDLFVSEPKVFNFTVPGIKKPQQFYVNNYGDNYYGTISLATATQYSDNSVYATLGLDVGTEDVAEMAEALGIETNVSENPAMLLGGLEEGVTPLEMAHAYQSIARDGQRISGTLAASPGGPVAIEKVLDADGELAETREGESGENEVIAERIVPEETAQVARDTLQLVVSYGTGKRAAYGGYAWGKTGTTENNGDAWFVGATEDVTVAVWVGHAAGNTPMETEYGGAPVDGGTYPAEIWHDVVLAYLSITEQREAAEALAESQEALEEGSTDTAITTPLPTAPTTTLPPPASEETSVVPDEEIVPEPAPETEPEPAPETEPPPEPATPPDDGGLTPAPGGTGVGRERD